MLGGCSICKWQPDRTTRERHCRSQETDGRENEQDGSTEGMNTLYMYNEVRSSNPKR